MYQGDENFIFTLSHFYVLYDFRLSVIRVAQLRLTDYVRTWKLRNRILATEVGPYILQSSGREAAAIYQSDSKDGARPQELTNHKDQAVYNDNYC